ncbi:hypothetical protein ACP4OV_002928 [Aristida adscensionis]
MSPPAKQPRAKKKAAKGSSSSDGFAALPPELQERILDLLPYWDVIRLHAVCRAWRRLRLHRSARVVNIDLRDLVMADGRTLYAPAIYGLRVALGEQRSHPVVETLDLASLLLVRRRAHAGARRMPHGATDRHGGPLDVGPMGHHGEAPFGDIAIDAPLLEKLVVTCSTGWTVEYRSFTLRAPALRRLSWHGQFAERVRIDVGDPGRVSEGTIEFASNGERHEMCCREMKYYRAQMIQMLRGLLAGLPPGSVADVARPYMKVDTHTVVDEDTGEVIPEETLTCDLGGLMSRDT